MVRRVRDILWPGVAMRHMCCGDAMPKQLDRIEQMLREVLEKIHAPTGGGREEVPRGQDFPFHFFARNANADGVSGVPSEQWTKRIMRVTGESQDLTEPITDLGAGWYAGHLTPTETAESGRIFLWLEAPGVRPVILGFRVGG